MAMVTAAHPGSWILTGMRCGEKALPARFASGVLVFPFKCVRQPRQSYAFGAGRMLDADA